MILGVFFFVRIEKGDRDHRIETAALQGRVQILEHSTGANKARVDVDGSRHNGVLDASAACMYVVTKLLQPVVDSRVMSDQFRCRCSAYSKVVSTTARTPTPVRYFFLFSDSHPCIEYRVQSLHCNLTLGFLSFR